jgi:hypothetical protein
MGVILVAEVGGNNAVVIAAIIMYRERDSQVLDRRPAREPGLLRDPRRWRADRNPAALKRTGNARGEKMPFELAFGHATGAPAKVH